MGKSFNVRRIRKPLRHYYEDFRSLEIKRIILLTIRLKIIFNYTQQLILHGLEKSALTGSRLTAEHTSE
ncbi:Hypothetical protein PMT_2610 [Prochlorococcus marinus str. MIT 9313]|uniref:Uncharacterized protein n=1 Tax=Prochlorococcus marinus (strain MIT 9313) TaxID=74547 RepID=B9ERZ8_PROMM|nr:Hypothetical protein PMT_2610 [Prochlorococcus marinus str. MIT 9313]